MLQDSAGECENYTQLSYLHKKVQNQSALFWPSWMTKAVVGSFLLCTSEFHTYLFGWLVNE